MLFKLGILQKRKNNKQKQNQSMQRQVNTTLRRKKNCIEEVS